MMYIDHIPNGETVCNRIDKLTEYISNFPESKLTPIFKQEIEYLETLKKEYGV